jgi:hypothetical protein
MYIKEYFDLKRAKNCFSQLSLIDTAITQIRNLNLKKNSVFPKKLPQLFNDMNWSF